MRCLDLNECFDEIGIYYSGNNTGNFLFVNAENYDDYQKIIERIEVNSQTTCVYISRYTFPNGLPNIDAAIQEAVHHKASALIGLSQGLMLQSIAAIEEKLEELLNVPIKGLCVIVLEHCEQILSKLMQKDIRLERKIILLDGDPSPLPIIKLAKSKENCIGVHPLCSISELLNSLEKMTVLKRQFNPVLTVVTAFSPNLFKNSVYAVSSVADIYTMLIGHFPDLSGSTKKEYGSDKQWKWLASQIKPEESFSALISNEFGSIVNLSAHIADVWKSKEENSIWLLWLALKVFGDKSNKYLSFILNSCQSSETFVNHIYLDLLKVSRNEYVFSKYFNERLKLIQQLPENLPLSSEYAEKTGVHGSDAIYYLTDFSDAEKYEFIRCLSIYDYTEEEIKNAVLTMSKPLALYLQSFTFDPINTWVSEQDADFRSTLTHYFHAYKLQKLTNRIYPEFLKTVNHFSSERPYNKLKPRSTIVSHQQDKKETQVFFFDALGVEYLSFIVSKCEEYGLVAEIAVGHAELPSITSSNKEFLQFFPEGNCYKIDELDELKHHSQVYNYEKTKLPIHIFEELEVIDKELRKIQAMLIQKTIQRALIVSDHGSSRLAVLYGHETETAIVLEEPGIHSGRCCPINEDPNLPFAAYEHGFSVLANYERFKGGRRANVEVHGGASLEEVVVPIITVTKRPDTLEMCFIDPVIKLKPRVTPELVLFSNIPLHHPRLLIGEDIIDGEFVADNKHMRFEIPKIKRKGSYVAEVYDGNKNLSVKLNFEAVKQTRERELF